MKARLYLDGQTIGEVDVSPHAASLKPGIRVTLAMVEPYPVATHRPLFISGLLETAEPLHVSR